MNLTVTFFGQIKAAVGVARRDLTAEPGTTARELVAQIAGDADENARRILLGANGQPRPSLLIVLNDAQLLPDEDPALQDGDRVTLMPPISGGITL